MRQTLMYILLGLCCVGCSSLATDPGSLLNRFKNRNTIHEREALLLRQADEAREQKQWDVAESRYCELLQINPQHEAAINNLGRLYYDQGKYYLAALRFSQALKIATEPAVQLNNLGLVQEASGRLGPAVEFYQQAMELDPECVVYRAHLVRVYLRQNRSDIEVEALLEDVIARDDRAGWREWAQLQLIKLRNRNLRALEAEVAVGTVGSGGNPRLQPMPEAGSSGSVLEESDSVAPPEIRVGPVDSGGGR